jgi:hypothetical protein
MKKGRLNQHRIEVEIFKGQGVSQTWTIKDRNDITIEDGILTFTNMTNTRITTNMNFLIKEDLEDEDR